MKAKPIKRQPRMKRNYKHVVQEQTSLLRERIHDIETQLRGYYGGIEQIYAFACGKKNLQKSRYSKRAQDYQRTQEDERRLQWTVETVQNRITQLQQELFQLIGCLP